MMVISLCYDKLFLGSFSHLKTIDCIKKLVEIFPLHGSKKGFDCFNSNPIVFTFFHIMSTLFHIMCTMCACSVRVSKNVKQQLAVKKCFASRF